MLSDAVDGFVGFPQALPGILNRFGNSCGKASAFEDTALVDDEFWCANFSPKEAALEDFNSPDALDIAVYLPADLNFSRLDIGLYRRQLANDQNIVCGNRPVEIPVQMQLPCKTEVSRESSSLRQEAIEFVGNGFVFTEHGSSPVRLIRHELFSGAISESTGMYPCLMTF